MDSEDQGPNLRYRIIPIADLPMPHNLSRCKYGDRFRRLSDDCGDGQQAAVRFYEQLTDAERASCDYHAFDWAAVANRSVEIIERLGTEPHEEAVEAAVRDSRLRKMEKWFLHTLLRREPIFLTGGQHGDGQHRACGLRFSGADRVVIQDYP
ncbi:MAG: hypothetical protein ACT4P1_11275 [Sporichthyaceae bacterium]